MMDEFWKAACNAVKCVLTLWPEICWFSQVRLWPSRRRQRYLLGINRPITFSHQPPHQLAAWLCQSIHVNQSQHRTRQLVFKSQMDHHLHSLHSNAGWMWNSKTNEKDEQIQWEETIDISHSCWSHLTHTRQCCTIISIFLWSFRSLYHQ